MKIGDLVTLSAYGKKVNRTGWIKEGDIGVIQSQRLTGGWQEYKIIWNQSVRPRYGEPRPYTTRGSYWNWELHFDRRDLKYVKKGASGD